MSTRRRSDSGNGLRHYEGNNVFAALSNEPFDLDTFMMSRTKGSGTNPTMGSPGSTSNITPRRESNAPLTPGVNSATSFPIDENKEQTAIWTDLKTKAGKDRKRLPLACIACRRKKIRCSGEKPACKHCLKSRQPCVYKVTARRAAPRTDYMAMLDKRLKRMEERVLKVIPKDEMQNLPEVARAVVKPPPPGQQLKTVKKRSAGEAFPVPAVERRSEPEKSASNQSPRKMPQAKQGPEESALLSEGKEHLPSAELQKYLANVYFDYVYGQSYHLLHKPSFMRRLEAGTIPPVLMLAVCAVSARFANHPQLRSTPAFLRGENWAKASLEIALKRFDYPNIATLTVFLLLGLHTLGTCQGGQSWMLGGMAHRMAYALRLHEDLITDGDDFSFTDREIRRRTMWSCFMMDRFMSSGTERPMFANEANIRIQLPIKEQLFQMEIPGPTENLDGSVPQPTSSQAGQMSEPRGNMGVAAYTVRLISIWGRLIRYFNQNGKDKDEYPIWSSQSTYQKLFSQVQEFNKALPEVMQYNSENMKFHAADGVGNQFLFMHVIYNHCVLTFNEFAIPTTAHTPPPKDIPPQFLLEARKSAVNSATNISRLIERASHHRLVAPFAGYCTYVSSAVHIYGAVSKNLQLEEPSRECLRINIKYLSQMKECWGMFVYLVDKLRDLYQLRADTVAKGIVTPNARLTQKSVFQYGDWYDRYPNGVSKTDYEEPEVEVKKEDGDDAVLSQRPIVQSVDEFFANLSPTTRARAVRKKVRQKSTAVSSRGQVPEGIVPVEVPLLSHSIDSITIPHTPFGIPESYDRAQIRSQQQLPLQNPGHLMVPSAIDPFSFQPLNQPSVVPQLDRQLVLASWNGMDQSMGMPVAPGGVWDMDMSALSDDMMLGEPSNAWFMPFNLDPTDFPNNDPGQFAGLPFATPQEMWYAHSERSHSLDGSLGVPGSQA